MYLDLPATTCRLLRSLQTKYEKVQFANHTNCMLRFWHLREWAESSVMSTVEELAEWLDRAISAASIKALAMLLLTALEAAAEALSFSFRLFAGTSNCTAFSCGGPNSFDVKTRPLCEGWSVASLTSKLWSHMDSPYWSAPEKGH